MAADNKKTTCVIYLYRNKSFRGYIRKIDIYIDGKKNCKIAMEKGLEIELEPGIHSIYAQCGMDKSTIMHLELPSETRPIIEVTYTMDNGLMLERDDSDKRFQKA